MVQSHVEVLYSVVDAIDSSDNVTDTPIQLFLLLFREEALLHVHLLILHFTIFHSQHILHVLLVVRDTILNLNGLVSVVIHLIILLVLLVTLRVSRLEHHLTDVLHLLFLILVEHVLIVTAVVVPVLGVTRILLGQYEHHIIRFEDGLFFGIGNNIVESLHICLILISRSEARLQRLIVLVVVQVDFSGSIETKRDDVPSGSQVIKQLVVVSIPIVAWNLDLIQVTLLDM